MKNILKVKQYIQDLIPYREVINTLSSPLNEGVVQTKNNKIFAVYKYIIREDNYDNRNMERRSNAFKELLYSFDKRFTLTFDYVKTRKIYEYPRVESDLKGVNSAEEKLSEYYNGDILFKTTLYLSVCMSFTNKDVGSKKIKPILTEEHLKDFESAINMVKSYESECGLKGDLLKGNELYTYLVRGLTSSFDDDTILNLPSVPLNDGISNESTFYPSCYPLKIDDRITYCHRVSNIPSYSEPNMFDFISLLPFPTRIVIKYNPHSKKETEDFLYKKKKEAKTSLFNIGAVLRTKANEQIDEDEVNYTSLSLKEETDNALSTVNDDNIVGGFYNINIMLTDIEDNEKMLNDRSSYLLKTASENHFGIKKEERLNTFAYFSSVVIGGGSNLNHNLSFYLSHNVADTFLTRGKTEDIPSPYLKEITHSDIPFMVCETLTSEIFNFSPFAEENVGHTLMVGETGGGKSITLSHFALEWLKYENTRVVYIDTGLSMLKALRENNGALYYPMNDDTVFSPFHKAKDNVSHVIAFVESMMIANGENFAPKYSTVIKEVIDELPYGEENLETFYALIKNKLGGDDPLSLVLFQYVDSLGEGIFNGKSNPFGNHRFIGIECEKLLIGQSKKLVYPSLTYILTECEKLFTPENPCMVILDEGWLYLKDEFFSFYIQNWLKTLRKKNAFVVLATQEITDLTSSPIATTILSSCKTRIFLSNRRAEEPLLKDSYKFLNLEDWEINIIGNLPKFYAYVKNGMRGVPITFNSTPILEHLKTEGEMKRTLNIKGVK